MIGPPNKRVQLKLQFLTSVFSNSILFRYSTQGSHSHASSHFALGQSAVEALHSLNNSNLNTNEVYVNKLQYDQPKSTILLPVGNNNQHQRPVYQHVPQINQIPAPYQQQGPIYQSGGLVYNEPQPQFVSSFQQHQPEVYVQPQFLHANPSGGVTKFILPNTKHVVPDQDAIYLNSNLKGFNDPSNQNNFHSVNSGKKKPINHLLQVPIDSNVASDNQKLAEQLKTVTTTEVPGQTSQFLSPIIVENQNQESNDPIKSGNFEGETVIFLQNIKSDPQNDDTVVFHQNPNAQQPHFEYYQQPQKQINIQILAEDPSKVNKQINGHTNHNNNFQYLVDDDQFVGDSTPSPQKEAPSRQFLKKFNGKIKSIETSTTTTETFKATAADEKCCKDKQKGDCCKQSNTVEKVLEITQRPISNKFLAPVHAGIRISADKTIDDCLDGHLNQKIEIPKKKTVVEVQKSVNIKNYLVKEKPQVTKFPAFGERIVVQQPIYIEKPPIIKHIKEQVFIDRPIDRVKIQPVFIEKPPIIKHTKEQVFVDRPVDRVVTKVVKEPVYIEKDPIIKHVHHETVKEKIVNVPQFVEKVKYVDRPYPVEVEKIVEKNVPVHFHHIQPAPPPQKIETFVDREVEKKVYIEKPPIIKHVKEQVFVDRPVDRVVTKIVKEPVYIEKEPVIKHIHHETVKEKIVNVPYDRVVEKIVEKQVPVHIHHTQPAQQIETVREVPVYIEKPQIVKHTKEFVDRPVEKIVTQVQPVYLESQPIIKHVHHDVIVEKEKLVNVPVEVIKYVDRPYPVEVEKLIEKEVGVPYGVPYGIPYAVPSPPVAIPIEKHHHHFHKPDFHVVAKTTTHKHKMFDLNSLFQKFMGHKQNDIKHIYVKPQHHQPHYYPTITAPASPPCDPFLNIGEHNIGDHSFGHTTRLEPVPFGDGFGQQFAGHQFGQEFNHQAYNFYGQNFDHASYVPGKFDHNNNVLQLIK